MDIDDINYSDEFVLVVDDEDYIREPIVEMLRRMGFRVDSAANGKHALEKLKEKPYTFLLTDMRMPEMDGLELIKSAERDYNNSNDWLLQGIRLCRCGKRRSRRFHQQTFRHRRT